MKKAKKIRFGLIGCGAMGHVIVGHVLKRWKQKAQWTGVYDKSTEASRALCKRWKLTAPAKDLRQVVSKSDWVVEAASPSAVGEILRLCLVQKKNLIVMSTGGLLSCSSLLKKATAKGMRVIVPSGAIAGLDGIKAARLGRIEKASIVTRKPPKALVGAPYLEERGMDVSGISQQTTIFEGNAKEAMRGFPANVNVAATLALATGLGPAQTRVRIVADPAITRNIHRIEIVGTTGQLTAEVQNVPSAVNPKTSAMAVLAACAAIDDIFSSVRIGT